MIRKYMRQTWAPGPASVTAGDDAEPVWGATREVDLGRVTLGSVGARVLVGARGIWTWRGVARLEVVLRGGGREWLTPTLYVRSGRSPEHLEVASLVTSVHPPAGDYSAVLRLSAATYPRSTTWVPTVEQLSVEVSA